MPPDSTSIDSPEFRTSMREKAAWIFLSSIIAVYGPYFAYVYNLFSGGRFHTDAVFNTLIDAVILQSILVTFSSVLFTYRQRKELKDERDAALEARSFRFAYGFLAVSCFLLVLTIPLLIISPLGKQLSGGTIALLADQVVLLCFVGAEVVKYLTLAIGYRRAI